MGRTAALDARSQPRQLVYQAILFTLIYSAAVVLIPSAGQQPTCYADR